MTDDEKRELLEIEVAVLRRANEAITRQCQMWRSRYMRATGHPAALRGMFGVFNEDSTDSDD